MSEDQPTGPKQWVATPALCWLVFLNFMFVVGPYLAPDKGTTILMIGRLPLAGMVGVWVVMGTGRTARRLSVISGVVLILAVLDSLSDFVEFWNFLIFYCPSIAGGAMMGMIGNVLRRRESDPIGQPPQFSIAEIAGWTALIAAVLGVMVLLRELELAYDSTLMIITLGFYGAFVGLICLPLFAAPGESRGRWIGGAILSAVLFLFLECEVYHVYEANFSENPHSIQNVIYYVIVTKIPSIIVTLAMVIPLGYFPLWREVDVFESPGPPPEK